MKTNLPMILPASVGALLFAFSAPAQVASNPPYTLEQTMIAGGGGTSGADGTFSVTGAIGQAAAGTTSINSPFTVHGGFFTPQVLAPTATGVTVGGRVLTADNRGIRSVRITLTTADGVTRTTLSGASGRYIFSDVAAGQTVIVSVAAKRFVFSQPMLILDLNEEAGEVNFVGTGQFFIE